MLSEKAKSRAQQKLFGIVRSYQKGELENPSPEVEKIASTVSKSDVKKMASTKHEGLPEKKKVEEAAFLASLGKMAMSKGKGMVKQKAKQVVKQKAANVAQGAIPQPNRDQVEEGAGRAAIGAGLGAIVGGPVGAAIGGSIGAAMGKKKKKVTTGGKQVKKTATNFFKAEPKVTRSEGVINMVRKGLERDKKAKVEQKIKNRKAVPYAALGASYQPEGEIVEGTSYGLYKGTGKPSGPMAAFAKKTKKKKEVKEEVLDEVAPALAAVPAAAAKGAAVAGKVAVKGAAMVGKAVAKGAQVAGKAASSAAKAAKPIVKSGLKAAGSAAKSVGKAGVEGLKSGAKTAGKTVAVAAGDAGANVVKSAGDAAAQRVKQKIAGSAIAASYEPELSIVDKMVMKYSPLSELKNSTLLSYTQKATNDLAFSGDGKKKARKRATGIKAATGKLAIRATDPDGSMGFNKNPKNEEIETLRKIVEEVGISSAAAMEKARKEAKLRAKEEAKVASKKKVKTEEVVQEADTLSATIDRWEAARQKRMKQRQSYERPHWIPRDQDHSDNWGSSKGEKRKPQKKNANLQNEAKVDAGLSPEEKEKARNIRRFGVSHNVAGHGKLRRALERSNRGDKKIRGDKSQYVETEAYRVLAKDKTDSGRPDAFSYQDEEDANKFAASIRKKGGKATVQKEGLADRAMKIVDRYRNRNKKKTEKKPSMDPTTKKLNRWRQDVEQKEREKYVSPFKPIDYD